MTTADTPLRSGGAILVDALRIHGADRIFGVPGESALPVFDALRDGARGVRFIEKTVESAHSTAKWTAF